MNLRCRMAVLRISKDFAIGFGIFAVAALAIMADPLLQTVMIGADLTTFSQGLGESPWILAALGLIFSSMLAFGLWFYRHMARKWRPFGTGLVLQ